MKLLETYKEGECDRLSLIISDVDDTITTEGRLHPDALIAMGEAVEKGYKIILLSGGSAGWCDVYLRQWPVYMVIAESGALLLYKDENGTVCYEKNPLIKEEDLKKRETLLRMLGPDYLSSDQYARLYDIAVDLHKIPSERVEDVKKEVERMGGHYAFSSIHMNIWFGDYSKRKGLLTFINLCGIEEGLLKESSIYLGDAPNDSDMFSLIPLSVGMVSVMERAKEFASLPRYYVPYRGGRGFSFAIDELPAKKS